MNKENKKFNNQSVKIFSFFFFSLLILHIVQDNLENTFRYFTKPLLLSSLLIFFIKQSNHLDKPTRNLMVMALLFSLAGDILLMFVPQSPHFFSGGLAAFLLAHLFYILVFYRKKSPKPFGYGLNIGTLIYVIFIGNLIVNNLGELMFPVVLYMVVIMLMFLFAAHRIENVCRLSYHLVLIGAILFVISDSILALNKFYKPILYPQISIMLTYGLAQFFITLGILKQED